MIVLSKEQYILNNSKGIITMKVEFNLYARNSSGVQTMHLTKQEDNEYFFTLTGDYRGKDIQIDFDVTSRANLLRMQQAIELALNN
jgi:hypothetical protein